MYVQFINNFIIVTIFLFNEIEFFWPNLTNKAFNLLGKAYFLLYNLECGYIPKWTSWLSYGITCVSLRTCMFKYYLFISGY